MSRVGIGKVNGKTHNFDDITGLQICKGARGMGAKDTKRMGGWDFESGCTPEYGTSGFDGAEEAGSSLVFSDGEVCAALVKAKSDMNERGVWSGSVDE